jgi:acyl transferase domain-containing protein
VLAAGQTRTAQLLFTVPEGQEQRGPEHTPLSFNLVSFVTPEAQQQTRIAAASHAAGTVSLLDSTIHAPHPATALSDARQRCRERLDISRFYVEQAAHQIELGAPFRWVAEAWRGSPGTEILARLVRPESVTTLEGYALHPGLLDACFQAMGMVQEADKETRLPFALESLRLHRAAQGEGWWCHARLAAANRWDIVLWDGAGSLSLGHPWHRTLAGVALHGRLAASPLFWAAFRFPACSVPGNPNLAGCGGAAGL